MAVVDLGLALRRPGRLVAAIACCMALSACGGGGHAHVSGEASQRAALDAYVQRIEPLRLAVNRLLERADPILGAFEDHRIPHAIAARRMGALERRFAGYAVDVAVIEPATARLRALHALYAHTYVLEDSYLAALVAGLRDGDLDHLPDTQNRQRAAIIHWRIGLTVLARRLGIGLPADLQQAGRGEIAPSLSGESRTRTMTFGRRADTTDQSRGGVSAVYVRVSASDEALLAGFATGDPDAAAEFVRRFQARAYGLAVSILGDSRAAEDVAQETFIRAWRHAGTYDARRGPVSGWLLTIARNLSLDRGRLQRAWPMDPELLASQLEQGLTYDDDDDATTVDRERLRDLVVELPLPQRRALVLATYFGRTAKEISELDGTPVGTVKTRIRDALIKLRTRLQVEDESSS